MICKVVRKGGETPRLCSDSCCVLTNVGTLVSDMRAADCQRDCQTAKHPHGRMLNRSHSVAVCAAMAGCLTPTRPKIERKKDPGPQKSVTKKREGDTTTGEHNAPCDTVT